MIGSGDDGRPCDRTLAAARRALRRSEARRLEREIEERIAAWVAAQKEGTP